MNFTQALEKVYRERPCQVLPNALWKTLSVLDGMDVSVRQEEDRVVELLAWRGRQLYVCWTASGEHPENRAGMLISHMDFLLLHQWHSGQLQMDSFTSRRPYFRLCHDLADRTPVSLPAGYSLAAVEPEKQADQVAGFINRCYPGAQLSVATILGWLEHPVYDPGLWVWIVDDAAKMPAALGIAEFDASIGEGSLEWVQVRPEYRRRGLGRALVLELLQRLAERASFVTVSGEVDSASQPEQLYRCCGFNGEDIWWLLQR
jgi:ribosomal protein S18 acetylase RimI-like enzyme